jgi:Flp pilus assembly pilin Flp
VIFHYNGCMKSREGQAMVEYMIMLVFVLSVMGTFNGTLKAAILGIWGFYTREIAAGCPGCPPDPRYHF